MAELELWNLWWVWMAAALLLAILEIFAPGFIFLGFAFGAALTALLLLVAPGLSLPMLLVVFAAFSLIAWAAMRRIFRNPDDQTRVIHEDINK